MQLVPLATPEQITLAADWLADKRNYEWLDFGNGIQSPGPATLKIMTQKDIHALRLFTDDEAGAPIGVVGLSNIDRRFRTATVWIMLGDRRFSAKGYALRAGAAILEFAFGELGLRAVNAWAVDCNHASLRLMRRLNFKPIGRQRACHVIDGQPHDRLWFDVLPTEYTRVPNG